MDRLLSMRVFQRVVDAGGFAAAARALDLSPTAVTRLVNDLEQHLGARLMQRTTRKLSLTAAGEAYLQRVRAILQDVDEAEAAAAQSSGELQGTLRVMATPIFASYFLAPQVVHWRRRYPQVTLDLAIDPFPQTRVDEFDVTFMVVDEGFDANIVARPLSVTQWILCASPAYLRDAGTPRTPQALSQHAYLRFPWQQGNGAGSRRMRLRPLAGGPTVEVEMPVALQSTGFDVLYRAALDGAGVAVLSRILIESRLASGELVHLLPDWIYGTSTVYVAVPTRILMPARTRAFLDFLAERMAARATEPRPQPRARR